MRRRLLRGVFRSLTRSSSGRNDLRREVGGWLRDALALFWRGALELVTQVRLWRLRRRKHTDAANVTGLDDPERRLLEARAARWRQWREQTMGRRVAVIGTGIFLVLSGWQIARVALQSSLEDAEPVRFSNAVPAPLEAGPNGTPTTSTAAPEPAAQNFERALSAASTGTWTFMTEGPVIPPGAIDQWDDFAIGYLSVLRDAGGSSGYQLWYRGCSLGVRGQRCAIGHAQSPDGIRWKKTSGPVFSPPEAQAANGLGGVTVVRSNGRYYLWYSIAPAWLEGRKTSTLHLATSPDGRKWEAAGQVLAGTEHVERHLDPSALWDGQRFHLWIVDSMQVYEAEAYKPVEGAPFLRHLISHDGRDWKESGSFPLATLQIPRVRPTVAARAGNGYRAALFALDESVDVMWIESADGDTWELASPARTSLEIPPVEQLETIDDATALDVSGGTLAWFVGGKDGSTGVRLGFLKR